MKNLLSSILVFMFSINMYSQCTLTITANANPICNGDYALLTAISSNTSSTTYTWSTGVTTQTIGFTPTVTSVYSVSATVSGSCTVTQTINLVVDPTPTISIIGSHSVCLGTSTTFTISGCSSYTPIVSYTYAPIIGTTLYLNPLATSHFTILGTSSSGCIGFLQDTLIVDNTCADVWPGDANSDGIVDNLDILELGLHFGQTGIPRAITSNLWQSYFSNNWSGTISSGKNLNHSNCNGDGIIDNNDTLAIFNNYSLTHAFKMSSDLSTTPQLKIVPNQSFVNKGDWGSASIFLGDATNPINNINGLAYTINYDNTLIETDSIYIEYSNSFLNPINQNLNFRKRNFSGGFMYTATTHTNNLNVSGFGKIATLHYKIKPTLLIDAPLNLSIIQAYQSNSSGSLTVLSTGSNSTIAVGSTVGLNQTETNNRFYFYPNPSNSIVNIISDLKLNDIEVFDFLGNCVLIENKNIQQIDLSELPSGLYFIKVTYNNNCSITKKMIKE